MERDRRLSTQAVLLTACLLAVAGRALPADPPAINWVGGAGNSLGQPASFYGSTEALRIAETVLLYQCDNGGYATGLLAQDLPAWRKRLGRD